MSWRGEERSSCLVPAPIMDDGSAGDETSDSGGTESSDGRPGVVFEGEGEKASATEGGSPVRRALSRATVGDVLPPTLA